MQVDHIVYVISITEEVIEDDILTRFSYFEECLLITAKQIIKMIIPIINAIGGVIILCIESN